MPRPLKNINAYNYRAGVAERFPTKNNECPPSSGIPYIQVDEGQVGPKYMRGTVIQAPMEQDFQKQSNVPFGFLVHPLAEPSQQDAFNAIADLPVIDYENDGPFRCYRCKAYVNPNMVFIEGGTKASCNMC
jgi:protein transport protein SEC24